ncbi:SAV_915 family protein [Spirillospora sp. CA-294931]|uniref:SAV_915 family protein n=1 Tax=Spirillospora sp. CA-294931 TaxID=3240042 RepID=UPI003D92DA38
MIRTGRLAVGERVGVGFTSRAGLAAVFGPRHPSIALHLRALRALLAPRGITRVQIDPEESQMTANDTREAG